jgi:hypothetical protein
VESGIQFTEVSPAGDESNEVNAVGPREVPGNDVFGRQTEGRRDILEILTVVGDGDLMSPRRFRRWPRDRSPFAYVEHLGCDLAVGCPRGIVKNGESEVSRNHVLDFRERSGGDSEGSGVYALQQLRAFLGTKFDCECRIAEWLGT